MQSVKTAISIEQSVFDQMNTLAKKLKVSRSRLFATAAREFIHRHDNIELGRLIDDAYSDSSESESMVPMMRSNHYKMVKDQW